MRPVAPRWLLAAGACALLAGAGPAPAAAPVVFEDSRGESAGGPDIASVHVSGDAGGPLTVRVHVPDRAALTPDLRLRVWIDTDGDAGTLDSYLLWEPDAGARLFRCSGARCTGGPSPRVGFSYRNGPTFTVDADELRARVLRLAAAVSSGARDEPPGTTGYTVSGADVAPDQPECDTLSGVCRFWTYTLRSAAPRLTASSPVFAPAVARAGRAVTVRATVRTGDGEAVSAGEVACRARVGARPVRTIAQRFAGGRPACTFRLPRTSAGKLLRGTMTVRAEGLTATLAFARRIR